MNIKKRITVIIALVIFASSAFGALLTKSESKDSDNLCNSGIVECNLLLQGNGDGDEPPNAPRPLFKRR